MSQEAAPQPARLTRRTLVGIALIVMFFGNGAGGLRSEIGALRDQVSELKAAIAAREDGSQAPAGIAVPAVAVAAAESES